MSSAVLRAAADLANAVRGVLPIDVEGCEVGGCVALRVGNALDVRELRQLFEALHDDYDPLAALEFDVDPDGELDVCGHRHPERRRRCMLLPGHDEIAHSWELYDADGAVVESYEWLGGRP